MQQIQFEVPEYILFVGVSSSYLHSMQIFWGILKKKHSDIFFLCDKQQHMKKWKQSKAPN